MLTSRHRRPAYVGTFSLGNVDQTAQSVRWSFVADNSALKFLSANQIVAQTYAVTITDDFGGSDTENVTVELHGVNDAVRSAGNGGNALSVSVIEGLTAVTTIATSDADASDTYTWMLSGADAALFSISAAGVLSFNNAPDFENPNDAGGNRVYDLVVQVSDSGSSDTQAVTVTLTNANEPPVLAGDLAATVAEGGSVVITTADLGEADPDDAGTGLTYKVTAATNGEVRLNGTATTAFTAQDVADGLVTFQHDGSETTAASFEFTLADGGEDGATSVSGTFNLTVNQPPVAMADTGAVTGNVITSFSLEQIARGFGGFKIVGENAALGGGDFAGISVAGTGDVNGDGVPDVLVGAQGHAPGALPIWCTGRPMARLSISTMLRVGSGGFKIIGENAGDLAGTIVSDLGDLNNDGFADIVAYAGSDDGGEAGQRLTLSLATAIRALSIWTQIAVGNGGYKIIGFASDSRITHSITGVPDINGDRLPELLIGADGFRR